MSANEGSKLPGTTALRLLLSVCSLAIVDSVPLVAFGDDATFSSHVQPFLKSYCFNCHGTKQQKGDRRFDRLPGTINSDNDLVDLQDILDQLNLGEMPPSDQKQPTDKERREVVAWLTDVIADAHEARKEHASQTILRRLNAREYRNTVRDLLQIEVTMFDPTHGFPQDQKTGHLDNVGETLVTSGYLLQRYLDAAENVVNKAMTPIRKPKIRTWTFKDNFQQQPEIDQVHRKTSKFEFMTLFEVRGADKHEGAYGAIRDFVKGVPEDGYYEIRFDAEALNRVHQYDDSFLGTDKSEPLRLGIVPGDHSVGELHHTQPIEPLLVEMDIADERKWYTTRVWLDAGMTPRFTFENGSMDVRSKWGQVIKRYPDFFPKPKSRGIVESRYLAIKHGKFPQIRIHEFEIRGPVYDEWPTPGHRAILGEDWDRAEDGSLSESDLRNNLNSFLQRAYRRSVQPEDVERILSVIKSRREAGRSPIEAYADGLKAALCSPAFLYLESSANDDGRLTSTALASRLSYFLWASMPDDELLQLALSEKLTAVNVLETEIDRMLADSKSDEFIDGFLGSWLTLSDLGATPPDRGTFNDFYHYDLNSAMRQETKLFVRHMIDENLDVASFLDSDFTFVNKALARHYDIKPPKERGFHKVALSDRRRGGLLGQASVLTVTANGIDTSPVVRGVWLLENLLGTPPSPPPPDVEPLDPDIRGAKTIRDQLQKHRNVASCNDCHRKIDPLGFALENYDPVGAWRTSYGKQGRIDASGVMPDGRSFADIEEFKRILMSRKHQFSRALTAKLLAYANGRQLTPSDRPAVDAIVKELSSRGGGFRDLIVLVATSETFRSK